jgi:signal transduction histidine kinase
MTLTGRVSLFFLGALAAVLVGFSAVLYALAHAHLHRQADERLEAVLNALAAAAEIMPGGVEWSPHDRALPPGRDPHASWLVLDDRGHPLDRSDGPSSETVLAALSPARLSAVRGPHVVIWEQGVWRLALRRLDAPATGAPAKDDQEKLYPSVLLLAGASLEPTQATLRGLAATLLGLSAGLWALAAVGGRWLGRRALRPVRRMAQAARGIRADDLGQRLPLPHTGDELDELGKAFNDLLGRLEESFERQRRFTGDASHQLRTPLTALLGQIDVTLRRERPPDEYRRVLNLVQGQAVRLNELVEMLLFLARADAESGLTDLEDFDLAEWLPEHLKGWARHPRAMDLRLEAPEKGALVVRAHGPLLGQLVDNLLDNACKYGEPGTPVVVRLLEAPGAVVLEVEDAGRGIAEEDLPHVFEPFYRAARAPKESGVGLGLAVARRIALALRGELDAHSKPGAGSRFSLRLPQKATGTAAGER